MRSRLRLLVALCPVAVIVATGTTGRNGDALDSIRMAATRLAQDTTSLGAPTMESVNVPARVVRVATVPGSSDHEAWALAYTSARTTAWDAIASQGQVAVFLHYSDSTGWQNTGPAVGPGGDAQNLRLNAIAVAPGGADGEGWAVGGDGALVHHDAGSNRWVVQPSYADALGKPDLESVSLAQTDSGLQGFASGQRLTMLKLSGSSWSADAAVAGPPATADLIGVAATSSSGVAWAVTGDTANGVSVVYRSGGLWKLVTSEAMFTSGTGVAQDNTTQILEASGGAVAATPSGGAWVVGKLVYQQSSQPFGDQLVGDASRPFALQFDPGGTFHSFGSFCPAVNTVQPSASSNPVHASSTKPCDNVFPLAAFGLTSVVVVQDQVFAGGEGLFHYTGTWHREPDPIGFLASVSMASPTEGWVSGTGSNAAGPIADSGTLALGHWTEHPMVPHAAPWPDPTPGTVEGVALSPDGSGRALAVTSDASGNGMAMSYTPGVGWTVTHYGGPTRYHAIAWPATNSAWVAGDGMLDHFDGSGWGTVKPVLPFGSAGVGALYGLAFTDASHGWAVGANGVILDDAGGTWTPDAASGNPRWGNLFAIASIPGGAVAAGDGGKVLVNHGGGWTEDQDAENAIPSGRSLRLFAAAGLPDGTLALGGEAGLVLLKKPGQPYTQVQSPIDGTVMALGLSRDSSGAPVLVASISPRASRKYVGGTPVQSAGWLFAYDASGWHDIEGGHRLTMWQSTDTAAQRDPAIAIAMAPTGMAGWAVGGYPAQTLDSDNGAFQSGRSTGSLYRVNLAGDAAPPAALTTAPAAPKSGFSFAFLGDSACANGICSAAYGSGDMADSVLQAAQQEINTAIAESGVSLVIDGGNLSRTGLPDDLNVFAGYMQGFRDASGQQVPVYAALGNQDLVSGADTGQLFPGAPSQQVAGQTNQFYVQTLDGAAPAPWGAANGGHLPAGVHPVQVPTGAVAGEALTYYAFDFQPEGLDRQARFIILNDSETAGIASTDDNPPDTAPAQPTWLQNVVTDPTAKNLSKIVVLNNPVIDPISGATNGTGADVTVEAPGNLVSAVFASHLNGNLSTTVGPTAVPEYVSGGAGSPLDGSRNPNDGYYHAWLLVTVDPNHPTSTGAATVTVKAMPVLTSVAMYALPSSTVRAGDTLYVDGLGRAPDMGLPNLNGPHPDPRQSQADYIRFPITYSGPSAMRPYYQYKSENPEIADFVGICAGLPCAKPGGGFFANDQAGFLCAYQPGTAWIDLIAGTQSVREPITVTAGKGICNEHPLPPPPPVIEPKTTPAHNNPPVVHQPQVVTVAPQPRPAVRPHPYFPHLLQTNLVPVVVPPPVPVLAGAPPLTAAGTAAKKEEEREKALEHSQEQGGHTHQAVAYRPADDRWDPTPVAAMGAAALILFVFMCAWAASRKASPASIDLRRWE